ncbi:SDR family NAD(P)-dependent oxidoreductase [Luteipulveratus mongoliensis]|uniref:3-ketoacyl-ACP reductase n=1 Tax=Luteipulveratus mongoliensis TaxID=571913 RepID=A0A0K1JII1_9MICO|nr:SDR family NAD(P)-dependent oxidoreductase [Luteipulveratus mongoliensis]AKU16390.1 3-ketoacyl-ACP reductase [Luteipulveratus mongoliensis]
MATTDRPVWFITGASTGLGRAIALAAEAAGNAVVATARRPDDVADLAGEHVLTTRLDVTDAQSITDAVAAAHERFGRIDVLVNNAGYSLRGALEEWADTELRDVFDVNVFGVANVTREVLPAMREQGSGTVVMMSSIGGVRTTLGGTAYNTTKFALEGLSEGLSNEVAAFGVRVLIVEPGPFRTDFAGRSNRWPTPLPAYDAVLSAARERFAAQDGQQTGDPDAAARVIVEVASGTDVPLRLPLGPESFDGIRARLQSRLSELDAVEPIGRDTSYQPVE